MKKTLLLICLLIGLKISAMNYTSWTTEQLERKKRELLHEHARLSTPIVPRILPKSMAIMTGISGIIPETKEELHRMQEINAKQRDRVREEIYRIETELRRRSVKK